MGSRTLFLKANAFEVGKFIVFLVNGLTVGMVDLGPGVVDNMVC